MSVAEQQQADRSTETVDLSFSGQAPLAATETSTVESVFKGSLRFRNSGLGHFRGGLLLPHGCPLAAV